MSTPPSLELGVLVVAALTAGVLVALTPTAAAASVGQGLKCPDDLHVNVGVTHCMCSPATLCVGSHCATGHFQQFVPPTVQGQKIPRDVHGFSPAHCPDCRCVPAFVLKDPSSDLDAFPSEPNVTEVHYTARPGKRAKIAIATVIVRGAAQMGAESAYQYAEVAFPNHREYCRMHGYDYIIRTANYDYTGKPERDVRWAKVKLLQGLVRLYENVFWTDGDTFFTNCSTTVESVIAQGHGREFIFAGDGNGGLNSGGLIVRNDPATDWLQSLLGAVWDYHGTEDSKNKVCGDDMDNGAFNYAIARPNRCQRGTGMFKSGHTWDDCKRLMAWLPDDVASHVHCVPQSLLNANAHSPRKYGNNPIPVTVLDPQGVPWGDTPRLKDKGYWRLGDYRLHLAGCPDKQGPGLEALSYALRHGASTCSVPGRE